MQLYRITREKYADSLEASGRANRWNKEKEYVIYAASSRALAVLELTAHRNAIMSGLTYKIVLLHLQLEEEKTTVAKIPLTTLPKNWNTLQNYFITQKIGSDWYKSRDKLLLQVPSAIVHQEFNYVVNTQHPDFKSRIKITQEAFRWDPRLL